MAPDQAAFWRVARQPRWLALLGVVVVLCVAFGWLGRWQLDVARSKEHPHHAATAPGSVSPSGAAALDAVTAPQQVFRTDMVGRAVTATGEFDASRQVLVAKRQGGADGVWVVTPLRTATGALVPVVRGFAPSTAGQPAGPAAVAAPPSGPVTVSGTLEPPDAPAGPGADTPAGTLGAADTADLVNRWGGPIYNVLLFGTAGSAGSAGLALVPAPAADGGGSLGLRNAAYALQWWLFAAFAVLLWWRMVRQDAADRLAAAAAAPIRPTKELTA